MKKKPTKNPKRDHTRQKMRDLAPLADQVLETVTGGVGEGGRCW